MTAHKTTYIISFLISAALCITTTDAMMKKLTRGSKKNPLLLTENEVSLSSYMSIQHTLQRKETCQQSPTEINVQKEDILFFQKIIHQPLLYQNKETFPDKKYFKALTIAAKLKAPLLYAELLAARLPSHVTTLITENYLRLHNMPEAICNMVHHREIMIILAENPCILCDLNSQHLIDKYQRIIKKYLQNSNTLDAELNAIIRSATLTQSVLLSMIANNRRTNHIAMKIIMHMPGYNAFMAWTEEQRDLMCEHLPITIEYKATKTGCWATESFNLTV